MFFAGDLFGSSEREGKILFICAQKSGQRSNPRAVSHISRAKNSGGKIHTMEKKNPHLHVYRALVADTEILSACTVPFVHV